MLNIFKLYSIIKERIIYSMDTSEMFFFEVIMFCQLLLRSVQPAIVNVALNQPSIQQSTETTWHASRANDGNASNALYFHESSCSATNTSGYLKAWWQVDLGQSFNVSYILLTPRNWYGGADRLAGFSIFVSLTEKQAWAPEELCFHDSVPQYNVKSERRINCTDKITGRYVAFYNERPVVNAVDGFFYSRYAILELCEVIVPIEIVNCSSCIAGWYGKRCELSCAYCGGGGTCNKDNGYCTSCVTGYYGVICDRKCPTNCFNKVCNFNTGQCLLCENLHYGKFCDKICPNNCISCMSSANCTLCQSGWFGASCSSNCSHCGGTGDCDKYNGKCLSQTCKTGFYGSTCFINCPRNCGGNGSCDRLNGICAENCNQGWKGHLCDTECEDSTYGENCSMKCGKCKNNICDNVYGTCHLGCEDGWSNIRCDTEIEEVRSNLHAAVTGGVLGTLVLVLFGVIVFLLIFGRCQVRKKKENIYMSQVDNSAPEDRAYASVMTPVDQRTMEQNGSTSTHQAISSVGNDSSYEEVTRTDVPYINTTFSSDAC